MDNESPRNRIALSKNASLFNKSRLMMLSSNNLSKPKSNILQKMELEDIVAQNNRLKNKVNYLNDENIKIKTRLTVAEKQKHKLINQTQFFSMESRQIRPYSTKKLNGKIFNPRSSMKITKTSESLPMKNNLKIQNYMKDALRQSKDQNQKLKKQIGQLKRKVRYTRINELQAENNQLLAQTIRLTQQLQINRQNNFNNLNPLLDQINELKAQISVQISKRKKIEYQLRKGQSQKQQILQKLYQSQEKVKKLQKSNNIQKKQHQQALQKLRQQLNNNRNQIYYKNQEYHNLTNHQFVSGQISTINKLKNQNSELKNQLIKYTSIIKSGQNQLVTLKKIQNNKNNQKIQSSSPQKNKNNKSINKQAQNVNKYKSKTGISATSNKDKNNIQVNNISNKNILENNKSQMKSNQEQAKVETKQQLQQNNIKQKNENIEKLSQIGTDKNIKNSKLNNHNKMFSDDSQLQKIMNQDLSQQDQHRKNYNQQLQYKSVNNYVKDEHKKQTIKQKQEENIYQNQQQNYQNEQQQQFLKQKKQQKNKGQHQQKRQNQQIQSDEQVLFQKQSKNQKKQKKKLNQLQNKEIKLLKTTITYRLKAYHYTYQNFVSDIQNSGTTSFQIDNLKGFLSDEPFMLNENQFQILISEMNVSKNKVSSEILIKKMKKFIGQIQFLLEQQEAQQIQNLKNKIIYIEEQIYQKLGKSLNSISRKYLTPILQYFNFTKQQVDLFISQSMLVSTDCSKINCKKTIEMLKYEKNEQKSQNQLLKRRDQNQEEYQQIYGE